MEAGYFSPNEISLISDVAHIALDNAGKALGTMSKDEILIKDVSLANGAGDADLRLPVFGDQVQLLYTRIVGELNADTYLVISPQTEQALCEQMLPGSELGQTEMRQALLMEIDNIVVASMVTKFADILKRNTHGDVPSIKPLSRLQLEAMLKEKFEHPDTKLSVKAGMRFFYKSTTAWFFCFFDHSIKSATQSFDFKKMKGQKLETEGEAAKEKPGIQTFFKKLFV